MIYTDPLRSNLKICRTNRSTVLLNQFQLQLVTSPSPSRFGIHCCVDISVINELSHRNVAFPSIFILHPMAIVKIRWNFISSNSHRRRQTPSDIRWFFSSCWQIKYHCLIVHFSLNDYDNPDSKTYALCSSSLLPWHLEMLSNCTDLMQYNSPSCRWSTTLSYLSRTQLITAIPSPSFCSILRLSV